MNHWITFMNSRFTILVFRPLCLIKKGPNMNCDCITKCNWKTPYKNILYYRELKYLPKHSQSSEGNKKCLQI